MSEVAEYAKRMTVHLRRLARNMAAFNDQIRLTMDALIRHDRHEWEYPDRVLTDDERDAIHARQLGRTLADIDDLPEAGKQP